MGSVQINITTIPMSLEELQRQMGSKAINKNGRPKMYKIIFNNNDKTSEQLVVLLLIEVFGKTPQQAYNVMKMIERQGKGVVKTYNTKKEAVDKKVECLKICKLNRDTSLKIEIEEH